MTPKKKPTVPPKVGQAKPRCAAVDDRGNRCVGRTGHPGAHGATDGAWWLYPQENASGAKSVADAALDVLQRPGERRRVELPQESDKRLREELYAAGFLLEDESTLSGVRALLQSHQRLQALVQACKLPTEKQFTATALRKYLDLSDNAVLQVEGLDGMTVTLDDEDHILWARMFKR